MVLVDRIQMVLLMWSMSLHYGRDFVSFSGAQYSEDVDMFLLWDDLNQHLNLTLKL